MRYISLFSGIGGFEIAIHNIFPNAECIGFSEVDKFAIQVYKHHFPNHRNMGSVVDITEEQIRQLVSEKGCDLIVGGFPCQNLSSLANINGDSSGLQGPKSSLFYNMIQIIDWIQKHNPKSVKLQLLAENNASMSEVNKKLITSIITAHFDPIPIYCTMLNGADFGVQNRRRLYWTTWNVSTDSIKCEQTWDNVLEPIEQCTDIIAKNRVTNEFNKLYDHKRNNECFIATNVSNDIWQFEQINENKHSKWQKKYHSDTINTKCSTRTRSRNFHNVIIDRRFGNNDEFIIRHFSQYEIERLFWFPKGWVSELCSKTRCSKLLGNTVIVRVIEHIFGCFVSWQGVIVKELKLF
jgi:DNA (cytosine-5)-methyltransferase 1